MNPYPQQTGLPQMATPFGNAGAAGQNTMSQIQSPTTQPSTGVQAPSMGQPMGQPMQSPMMQQQDPNQPVSPWPPFGQGQWPQYGEIPWPQYGQPQMQPQPQTYATMPNPQYPQGIPGLAGILPDLMAAWAAQNGTPYNP